MEISDRKRLAHLVKSTQQHRVLIDLASKHGWRNGAEIGVLRGKTLFALLSAIPVLTMIGVDQWKRLDLRSNENAETYVDFDMEELHSQVVVKAKAWGNRCKILRGDSVEMSQHVLDASLDFVFVDGDHTEEGVERDIRAWTPKVVAGGMVIGHDHHWSTVNRVLARICPKWRDYGEAVWGVPVEDVSL